MATAITIQAPQAFTRGVTIYPPHAIPAGVTSVTFAIDRAAFVGDPGNPDLLVAPTGDGAVAFQWTSFLSLDAGVSWLPWGGAGATGGVVAGVPTSGFVVALPHPELSTRQLAATLAVTGPITLGIIATVSP